LARKDGSRETQLEWDALVQFSLVWLWTFCWLTCPPPKSSCQTVDCSTKQVGERQTVCLSSTLRSPKRRYHVGQSKQVQLSPSHWQSHFGSHGSRSSALVARRATKDVKCVGQAAWCWPASGAHNEWPRVGKIRRGQSMAGRFFLPFSWRVPTKHLS